MKRYFTATELKWAVVFFLMTLLWMSFEKWMGWHDIHIEQHESLTNIYAIPAILVYVFALLDKRKKMPDRTFTWVNGFLSGLVITLIVTILSPLTQLIISNWISPEYFTNIIEYSVTTLGKNRAEMEAYFNTENYILQGIAGACIMGILTSAIVALFTRRK